MAKRMIIRLEKAQSTDEMLTRMAKGYHDLLVAVAPILKKNKDIHAGLKEGLTKFLSNLCIALGNKQQTDLYSEKAYDQLKHKNKSKLVYEHVVPKNIYQNEILKAFMDGRVMSVEEIKEMLEKYWRIATITKEEDENSLLLSETMPEGWKKGDDPLARYHRAGITLHTWDEWSKIKV